MICDLVMNYLIFQDQSGKVCSSRSLFSLDNFGPALTAIHMLLLLKIMRIT